jgi:APA family basic amino acid/polyamine antiporter
MLVALALLVRRYYSSGVTTKGNQRNLIVCLVLIIVSSIGISAYWANSSTKGWIGYPIFVPIWFLGTGGLWLFVPMAKKPKVWGVPLVPWLPSISIAINIFLLGSIDKKSYMRFGIWTAFLLVYYVLLGLHASYDTAKQYDQSKHSTEEVEKQTNKVEQGDVGQDSSTAHVSNWLGVNVSFDLS